MFHSTTITVIKEVYNSGKTRKGAGRAHGMIEWQVQECFVERHGLFSPLEQIGKKKNLPDHL